MRDPKRIDEYLRRIRKAWEANPDLRFAQMFPDLFYHQEDESVFDGPSNFKALERQTNDQLDTRAKDTPPSRL